MDSRRRADLALVVVTLLWGVTFPLIRSALADVGPHQFVGWRFSIAVVAFLPLILVHPEARRGLRKALVPGLLLGVLAWSSYLSQTIGLQTVPAGRAAFITGTSVILVPLLAPLFRAGRPSSLDLAAALVATAGLYLLTGGMSADRQGLGTGDLWVLGCAVGYSIYIHGLQKTLRFEHHEVSLAFTQILGIFVCGAGVMAATGDVRIPLTRDVMVGLGVCALLATVGTFWLQTRYQGRTTPQRVALIFSLEPVFATGFAWWLLGETLDLPGALGAALIMAAVLAAEFLSARRPGAEPA